jgi:hypothetical protein
MQNLRSYWKEEKLLTPKLDSLLKHVGHRKVKFSMLGVDANSHYFNKNSMHVENERAFSVANQPFILD